MPTDELVPAFVLAHTISISISSTTPSQNVLSRTQPSLSYNEGWVLFKFVLHTSYVFVRVQNKANFAMSLKQRSGSMSYFLDETNHGPPQSEVNLQPVMHASAKVLQVQEDWGIPCWCMPSLLLIKPMPLASPSDNGEVHFPYTVVDRVV